VNSLIVQAWSMLLKPLMLVFSIFLLVRGHHEPGGGFVGGMVAAAAFTLSALAYNVASAKQTLHVSPVSLAALGLIVAASSGFVAVLTGEAYMTGVWATVWLPLVGEVDLGSVLLFDVGIYLVVAGITLMIVFALMESQEEYGN
jgi:multicomponent Na+:H+ antiporter subunit B